jgi:L,D-peptidoglycan transpeptidase YkuD (ErfK/YbiS/YcfS/YnhG family)
MSRTRRTVALLAAVSLLALLGPGPVSAEAASVNPQSSARWRACSPRLDGVPTRIGARQRTVTIVNQTSKTHARVSFWVRTDSTCSLTEKFLTTKARLGYGGTVDGRKRRQGTGTTPLGTYSMTESFGNGAAPDMWLPYHRVRKGDYWVGDNRSRYYNSLRNKSEGGFRYQLGSSSINSSEYLPHYKKQYRYAVVINFNRAPDTRKAYRGTGIFLHVRGSGATGGCVAISARQMRKVMAYLKSGDRITIAR